MRFVTFGDVLLGFVRLVGTRLPAPHGAADVGRDLSGPAVRMAALQSCLLIADACFLILDLLFETVPPRNQLGAVYNGLTTFPPGFDRTAEAAIQVSEFAASLVVVHVRIASRQP